MEKLIYALKLKQPLRPATVEELASGAGATNVRVNMRDAAVKDGAGLIQSRGTTLPDCVVQLWLQTSNIIRRSALDDALRSVSETMSAWLVSEATILENPAPVASAQRTEGFAQLAFLTLPKSLDWPSWRQIWRDSHTQIAIDTQSNFEYRQNLVVERLVGDDAAAEVVAIVEECFPIEALTDPFIFFAATGDPKKFKRNLDIMMTSCARFITPGSIDVFPTSQYDFRKA